MEQPTPKKLPLLPSGEKWLICFAVIAAYAVFAGRAKIPQSHLVVAKE